jgi:hypothetical protein
MSSARDESILALIERLEADLQLAREHSLTFTVRLLNIALLDLRTTAHSISEDELRQFSDVIAGSVRGRKAALPRHRRPRISAAPNGRLRT